jgi:hypothetical protein
MSDGAGAQSGAGAGAGPSGDHDGAHRASGFGCEICFDDPPTEPVVT